jgi:hypothetical protein
MAMNVSLTGVLFDAGSEWHLVSSIGPKLKKEALPGVQVVALPVVCCAGAAPATFARHVRE